MKKYEDIRRRILNQPSYWVELINGQLYDAIVRYMEVNNMKQIDLANHLDLSPGRVSQILNTGNINYSIEKIVDIALKVDTIPLVQLKPKDDFILNEIASMKRKVITTKPGAMWVVRQDPKTSDTKVLPLITEKEFNLDLIEHGN
jgi:predicted XRE-type DNA-binding protein